MKLKCNIPSFPKLNNQSLQVDFTVYPIKNPILSATNAIPKPPASVTNGNVISDKCELDMDSARAREREASLVE